MFSKNSRYKELKNVILPHGNFPKKKSKVFRRIPDTKGVLKHRITESDRLDLLAFKYYGNSQKWWKICDANPEYMYPNSLLNDEPFVTENFHLELNKDTIMKLPIIIRKLESLKGVQKTRVDQSDFLYNISKLKDNEGQNQKLVNKLQIVYNENETDQHTLKKILEDKNINLTGVDKITATGRQINIPAK